MKFSTILTTAFFALFIFTTTTTFATTHLTTEKTTINTKKEYIGDYIVTVNGRATSVENTSGRLPDGATMTLKITKGLQVVFEESGSAARMDIDLNQLSVGTYLLQVITSESIERHILILE